MILISMRILSKFCVFVLCIFSGIAAGEDRNKATLVGTLEFIWGDSLESSSRDGHHRISVIDSKGRRFVLDDEQALKIVPDLHRHNRRLVAAHLRQSKASAKKWNVEALFRLNEPQVRGGHMRGIAHKAMSDNAVSGVTTWITLLCKYSDYPNEYQAASYYQSRYGSSVGQLGHYWQEVSYGKISLSGSSTFGWYALPFPRSHYVRFGADGKEHADLYMLAQDCAAAADSSVNFSAYPNLTGINFFFSWDLEPGRAWGGASCVMVDGAQRCLNMTWNPFFVVNYTAWWAHEMGHGYGLPHANNSDGDLDPYDNPWGLMSDFYSNTVIDPVYGNMPKHLSIYDRYYLGWVESARKLTVFPDSPPSTVWIERASLIGSAQYQLIELINPRDTSRRYVIEVRMRSGYYESMLAGDAVIIHEVVPSRLEPAWSVDSDKPPADFSYNEGSMLKIGERWSSPDRMFCIGVKAGTAYGFLLSISSRCQIMSRPGGAVSR